MTGDPTGGENGGDQEFIDRRSGKDRRAEHERRHAGRRHRRKDVEEDRRSGTDRRGRQRRSGTDRRVFQDPRYKKPRPTDQSPPVYTLIQAEQIQHALSRAGHATTCPACGGAFTLGPVDRRGRDLVRQVSCASCGRSTVVTNCVLLRVLVLTRIEAMRKILVGTLAGVGHDVIQPPQADAAMELYRENPCDVVIMDAYALAEMGGQEFIRRLRREFPDPRVLVVAPRASYGRADPSATATQLGATLIVRTPFTREELLRAVREATG